MLEVTVVPKNETADWLKESPKIKEYFQKAYSACIKTTLPDVTKDRRFLANDHLVNRDFENNPIFVCGIDSSRSYNIIGVLYVWPDYRRQGIADYFVRSFQNQGNKIIQLCVDENHRQSLHGFYTRLGFQTLGNINRDVLGMGYVDYFWGPKPLKIEQRGSDYVFRFLKNGEKM